VEGWHDSSAQKLVGGYVMSKKRADMPDTAHGDQWGELIGQTQSPGDLYQQIGSWRPESYCSVSLLIGNRKILPDAGLSIELWVGGTADKAGKAFSTIGARPLAAATDIVLPPNGATAVATRSFAMGKTGTPGEPLWLRLVQQGHLGTNAVVLIDNVSATWTGKPVAPRAVAMPKSPAKPVKWAYSVRDIPGPEGAVIEAGGLCYWPDGTLLACTRRGEVWSQRDGQWNRFATGLMGALGMWADTVGEVYVTQWPELTRIRDLDGDLSADRYETVTAAWPMPGAKTDFVYGLCRDTEGNFYGSTHTNHGPWSKKSKALPRYNFGGPMGAPVIGRGWSFQVDPTGKLTWWSSGLRAPNGVGMNAAGDLFATDNQGDWVATSCLRLNVAFARIHLGAAEPIDMPTLKALMPTLGAHKSLLGVLLLGNRQADLDANAMTVLSEIAEIAKPHGVEIAIYPHSGDYTETVAQSLRVVRKVNRPDVGVMFNLFHWMNRERDRALRTVLSEARPWLKLVNINGSPADKAQVLPLDQGDFDQSELLNVLRDTDYRGPIGLMCWGLGGDARTHLSASMAKWQALTSRPRKIVFIGGADSHGPGAHDHKAGATYLKAAIDQATNIAADIETVLYLDKLPDDLDELDNADAIILMWEGWHNHLFRADAPAVMATFRELMGRGVGLMALHAASAVGDQVEAEYLSWAGGNKKFEFSLHPMRPNVGATIATPGHPTTRGVGELRFAREEFYRRVLFDDSHGSITPILTASPAVGELDEQTIAWAFERKSGGRTFNCTGPHFHETFTNPEFRKLLLNAILWVAGLEPPVGGVISDQ
jgi:sugar phosphate isomerase/epimerase